MLFEPFPATKYLPLLNFLRGQEGPEAVHEGRVVLSSAASAARRPDVTAAWGLS